MKIKVTVVCALVALGALSASAKTDYSLKFHQGELRRVKIQEVLKLFMIFPGVDSELAQPSVRTTDYSFTERVDTVFSDGSAMIAATLDSFKTAIMIGEGKDAETFFTFNSTNEYDLSHGFRDIKTLPRAQFLGQTLRFVMYPNGTVHSFANLEDFHKLSVGKGYDYDFVHAMLSLTDSLRMGQLLEIGFGGLGAVDQKFTSPSTVTEIPVTRTVTSRELGDGRLAIRTTYSEPPKTIEYLEGIATPLGIERFAGSGSGELTFAKGHVTRATFSDTAYVALQVDIEHMPETITRHVTVETAPIAVMRGGSVSIKETEVHHDAPKDPQSEATPADGTKPVTSPEIAK
jgi:hypothetical protein